MKRNIVCVFAVLLALFGSFVGFYVFKNIPLRTAIYRSFAKQTVYLLTEKDTLYSFGYFGVRKHLIERNSDKIALLKENDDFCHNCFVGHLIGRSGVIHGDYLYVAARSYIGGRWKSDNPNYLKGELLVLRKPDLSIVRTIPADYSMIEAKICKNILVVTGLQGFNIYDITEPTHPRLVYTYKTEDPLEFQGCDFFENDSNTFLAIARFDRGLSIYDITNPYNTELVKTIPIQEPLTSGLKLPKGLHVFRVIADYPYLYGTLAPTKGMFGSENDERGLIVYDISDLNNIRQNAVLIPKGFHYEKVMGDPQPSHIAKYGNTIYLNFGEKGIAVFDIDTATMIPRFAEIKDYANGKVILPISVDERGGLYMGSYENSDIYSVKSYE